MRLLIFLLALLAFAPSVRAQSAMGNVPIPPDLSQIGFTATTADQTVAGSSGTGIVRTFIWIFNYAPPDVNNSTLWVTFGKACASGVSAVNGAIQIPAGDDRVFGGARSQVSAQNVPQSSIHVCTSTGTAVGGVIIQ
jgi:hypothetical protein